MSVTAQELPRLRLADVRIDLKKLFLKLGEATTRVALGTVTGDWKGAAGGIITAAFGAADAVSLERSPGVLAWELIRNGLTRALGELTAETLTNEKQPNAGDQEYLDTRIELAIGEDTVRIDPSFFQNPASLPLVRRVEELFIDWLMRCLDLPKPSATALTRRLQSYFAVALHDEWQTHTERYEGLLSALTGPFAAAARGEQEWHRYHLLLIKQFDRPVFEEQFALSDVYVPLRAAWEEVVRPSSARRSSEFADSEDRLPRCLVVVDLESYIHSWLNAANPADAIRLIRGGPGSGKSTFARKLAADLGGDIGPRVLYFALQHFQMSGKLVDAIGEALGPNGAEAFSENPLSRPHFASREKPVLLIFDGLDELAQPGREADEQTRSFLRELRSHLDRWNDPHCRVFALLTGRPAVVQANRSALRLAEGQELEVLPFLMTESSIERRQVEGRTFREETGNLREDGRKTWWQKYKTCKAGEPDDLPEALDRHEVRDLSAEPLLLYLLVRSKYHRRPADEHGFNRNELYASLFQDVTKRRYAGGRAPAASHELGEKFEAVMEIIATAAWYGDGRTATVDDVRRWCPKDLKNDLDKFLNSDAGTTKLIAAFYFQQAEASRRRDAIEFTHKSFGEYLTARRLVRAVADPGLDCLSLMDFSGQRLAAHDLIGADLGGANLSNADLRSANLSDADLSCANLSDANLSDAKLRSADLSDANLSRADLSNADLSDAKLRGTDLSDANLSRAELRSADLSNADLKSTNLSDADLSRANLSNAKLRGADLSDADLSRADLRSADLSFANLRSADLSFANLSGADLRSTNLSDAELEHAIGIPTGDERSAR